MGLMNVAFFLTPKAEVVWLPEKASMHHAIEQMERCGYTAIPVLDDDGRYVGTLSEGDLLRAMTRRRIDYDETAAVTLTDVPRRVPIRAVGIDAEMEELLLRAIEQNFVPVVDSREVFIGIVRRRAIIEYFAGLVGRPSDASTTLPYP
jgi:CBS domain-containing protein